MKDIFTTGNNYRRYEHIDWSIFGSHSGMMRCESLVSALTAEERHAFLRENTAVMSDTRLKELMPVFHLLAKIQCSEDMLVELRGGGVV